MASDTASPTFTPHRQADRVLTPEAAAFVRGPAAAPSAPGAGLLARSAGRPPGRRRSTPANAPDFLEDTEHVRNGDWTVPEAPKPLADRRVEITGPVERKMMINALNSGAKVFMADLEDACSPTWDNVISAQVNLHDAVRGTIEMVTADKTYRLAEEPSRRSVVRPRGLASGREALPP